MAGIIDRFVKQKRTYNTRLVEKTRDMTHRCGQQPRKESRISGGFASVSALFLLTSMGASVASPITASLPAAGATTVVRKSSPLSIQEVLALAGSVNVQRRK